MAMKFTYYILLFWITYLGMTMAVGQDHKYLNIPNDGTDKIACSAPFQPIGDWCLLVDNSMIGTWNDVRTFCKDRGGDLVNMHDANILHDIFTYLNDAGLNTRGYWIGAYDLLSEGTWVWSYNNTHVQMGTPLWGVNGRNQEPSGGTSQNCAILNSEYFYYVFDDDCNADHAAICAPTGTNSVEKVINEVETRKAEDCPSPYSMIGSSCLLVSSAAENPWLDQSFLCENLGGRMAHIVDANEFGALVQFLLINEVTIDLWIGGSDSAYEGEWLFEDSSPVPKGTPFWGASESDVGVQEPAGGDAENCIALSFDDYYFFHDWDCSDAKGVVCEYAP